MQVSQVSLETHNINVMWAPITWHGLLWVWGVETKSTILAFKELTIWWRQLQYSVISAMGECSEVLGWKGGQGRDTNSRLPRRRGLSGGAAEFWKTSRRKIGGGKGGEICFCLERKWNGIERSKRMAFHKNYNNFSMTRRKFKRRGWKSEVGKIGRPRSWNWMLRNLDFTMEAWWSPEHLSAKECMFKYAFYKGALW